MIGCLFFGSRLAVADDQAPTNLTATAASEQINESLYYFGFDLGATYPNSAGVYAAPAALNNNKWGINKDPSSLSYIFSARLGHKLPGAWTIEVGGETGPSGYNENYSLSGSDLRKTSSIAFLRKLYVMPAYRNYLGLFGVSLGWAVFDSIFSTKSQSSGYLGDFRQNAGAPSFGIVWRIPPFHMNKIRRQGLDLWPMFEISYDFLKFDRIHNVEGTGIYKTVPDIDTDPNGSAATLDLSALRLKIGWQFELFGTRK